MKNFLFIMSLLSGSSLTPAMEHLRLLNNYVLSANTKQEGFDGILYRGDAYLVDLTNIIVPGDIYKQLCMQALQENRDKVVSLLFAQKNRPNFNAVPLSEKELFHLLSWVPLLNYNEGKIKMRLNSKETWLNLEQVNYFQEKKVSSSYDFNEDAIHAKKINKQFDNYIATLRTQNK